jgi:hypothetical protein
MEGYDINKIEVIDSKQPKPEELLTGDIVKGLDPHSPIKANAEIEKNEYMKFPEGSVQKVVGQKHEKGGVKMNIPDGTKVISDHLTLTKEQVKTLSKEHGLDLSVKDTYASVMEKYSKKIGLSKLNKEQEEMFSVLKKELDKDTAEGTARVNQQYLSTKINDIENRKKSLEEERAGFFDVVFDMQESTKKPEKEDNDNFKFGGMSMKNFDNLCKKYGLSPDQGLSMLRDGGYNVTPKFDEGGELLDKIKNKQLSRKEADDAINALIKEGKLADGQAEELVSAMTSLPKSTTSSSTTAEQEASLSDEEKKIIKDKWAGKTADYLNFKKTKDAILKNEDLTNDIYTQYQEVVKDPKSYTGEKKGNWESALKDRKKEEVIQALIDQEERNARLRAHGFDPKTTSQGVEKGSRTNKEAMAKIKATPGLQDLNFEKGYLGQAGYLAYDKTMRTDKYKKNYKISQSGVADERGNTTISGIDNANTNTTLGQFLNYDPDTGVTATEKKEEPKKDPAEAGKEGAMEDNVILPRTPQMPRMFFTPDQSALVPTPMEAQLKNNIRLGRIDPLKIGIENNVQTIADERQFVAGQLKDIPDSQRAAALASLLATSQKSTNQAITGANVTNAQNQTTADQFNIGQAGQEELYRANNALDYEQRQLTAKAKTEEALNNYYDYNRVVNVTNFQNNQKLNLMDSLFPDYNLDFMGASVNYDPNSKFSVQNRNDYLDLMKLQPDAVESQTSQT